MTRNQSIETSHELPVEVLFNQALKGFMSVHAELSKLPQDPNDVLQPANNMLRDLGMDVDSDYSMLITAALGNFAIDAGLSSFGMATHTGLSMGLDAASSVLMGIADTSNKKSCKTSFTQSVYPKAASRSKATAPNTTMMKNALAAKKARLVKNTAAKRKMLREQLNTHMENIKELMVFKFYGIQHIERKNQSPEYTIQSQNHTKSIKNKSCIALIFNGKRDEKPAPTYMAAPQSVSKLAFAA